MVLTLTIMILYFWGFAVLQKFLTVQIYKLYNLLRLFLFDAAHLDCPIVLPGFDPITPAEGLIYPQNI